MRKNLLFIHTFWLFLAAFVGIFFYVSKYQVGDVWLLESTESMLKTFWLPGVVALVCLLCAIPLGTCPKKKSTKIDCALLQVLIIVGAVAVVEILNVSKRLNNVPTDFSKVFHYFVLSGLLGYLFFLSCVCILKVMFSIIFKKESDDPKYASKIALLLTPAFIIGGVLACYLSAKSLINSETVSSYTDYIKWADKGVMILIIDSCTVIVIAHLLASFKTKKGLAPLIVAIVGLACGVVLACLLAKDVVKPGENFEHLGELAKFIIGAYAFACLVLVVSYALRPFISHVGNDEFYLDLEDKKEEPKEDEIEIEEAPADEEAEDDNKTVICEEAPVEEINPKEETKDDENTVICEEAPVEDIESQEDQEEVSESEEIKALKEELAKANEEIDALNKKLEEHIASNVHVNGSRGKESFSTENLTDKSHYETVLKTTITRGFKAKLIVADDSLKHTYSEILNVPFKYKRGNVRHAFAKDTIVLGRTKVAVLKMSPSSKAMYLYLNLPASYLDITKYHLKDFSGKTKSLASTPYRLRIKSDRSKKYAVELLEAAYTELEAVPFKLERPVVDFAEDLGPQTEEQMIENGLIKKKVVEETYLVEPVYAEEEIKEEHKPEPVKTTVVEDEDDDDLDDLEDENEEKDEE